MDGRHKDVECPSSCRRNCIDAIERHSIGMGVHKAEKFFGLRGKTANSGQCGQRINNLTYSDLIYDAIHGQEGDIDNQNSHGCDGRYSTNWKRTPGSQQR